MTPGQTCETGIGRTPGRGRRDGDIVSDPMGDEVHVVPNRSDSIAFYRLAIGLVLRGQVPGLLGNLRITLCDETLRYLAPWRRP